jgi:mono/diheme cytochrome c family protein
MKLVTYTSLIIIIAAIASCGDVKREPGKIYMPDMAYSRTHESYAPIDENVFTNDTSARRSGDKYFFNASPVKGSVRIGDTVGFDIVQLSGNDSLSYNASAAVVNPLGNRALTTLEFKEISRLYQIQCAICHGAQHDGNGPLYKAGKLAGQPAQLNGSNPKYNDMTEGMMYYSITYGKNSMGGYSSQLTKQQRWLMTKYIKEIQAKAIAGDSKEAGKDSVVASATLKK